MRLTLLIVIVENVNDDKNSEFLECVDHQKEAVASILKKKNINVESDKAIPMQLSFDFIEDND